ncbi:hypothetical protein CJJ09_004851 [Candidozyma auris]|nr:hypothetical protein CJJ09_004851 [[Candida] auris]
MLRNFHLHLKPTLRSLSRMTQAEKPIIFAPPTYQYTKGHLNEDEIDEDPIEQFHQWFDYAKGNVPEGSSILPESTVLSTARLPSGRVSSRVVLLKELDHQGFVVYSNWETSKKSKDYESNKWASLTFFWSYAQRQAPWVQDRGVGVSSVAGNPEQARVGCILQKYEEQFKDKKDNEIECPQFWGGMRIVPYEIEFWQGGVSRLHDRLVYSRDSPDQEWTVRRLAP